jgi:large subunit ribosomal protein L6
MVGEKNKVWESYYQEVEIPSGVSAVYENGFLNVKGQKGEVSKKLRFPKVEVKVETNKVVVGTDKLSKREKKIINTYIAHIKNLFKGVTEGFEYKLVVLFAKFPVTVELKGNQFLVKNLLGEKVPRQLIIPDDVKVEIKGGKEIVVSGIDKEKTGQVAASLEQLTKINNMDRRVVQDGIFIVEKPHRKLI